MTETTYREALRQALTDSMRRDPSIVILGEEVGKYGGAYGVTKGMLEEFGEARVRDTPISEEVIVGTAVGAAMTGLRPVAELMYVDFVTLAMDQLVNQAAKIRYMFGGQIGVPMVLRSQGGTYTQLGFLPRSSRVFDGGECLDVSRFNSARFKSVTVHSTFRGG